MVIRGKKSNAEKSRGTNLSPDPDPEPISNRSRLFDHILIPIPNRSQNLNPAGLYIRRRFVMSKCKQIYQSGLSTCVRVPDNNKHKHTQKKSLHRGIWQAFASSA
jgi:hypothetical protein